MREIKAMWVSLSPRERQEYEQKAEYVSFKLKAQKFKK